MSCRLLPRRAAALALVAGLAGGLLAGCAADKPKPTPLAPVAAQVAGRQVWNARLDSLKYSPRITAVAGLFVAAGSDGTVLALDASTGAERWRGTAGVAITAGVGSDGRFAAVVTRDNELVVLDQGRPAWKATLASRTTTAPLVAGERVFVMGVDRAVHAFDALDGRRLWALQRPGEALTLSQPGVLAPFKDTLLVGQGAQLVGVDPLRGTVRWEATLATPRGTNEVERLADLVGPVVRVGDRVCARAFQAAVACADAQAGRTQWTRQAGGVQGLGGDAELLFGADATDRISAWRAGSGEVAWTNETLLYRGLSAPLALGRTVVLGDVEGQVHFLDRASGAVQLRLPTDGSAVVAPPVASGTTVLVATRNGGLYAFRPE
jgi:outer membrane assembly lipoprotein YfgL